MTNSVGVTFALNGLEDFQSQLESYQSQFIDAVTQGIDTSVTSMKSIADSLTPVKTGYLLGETDTVSAEQTDTLIEGSLTNDASYALDVELGTRHQKAEPFFLPAFEQTAPTVVPILQQCINSIEAE